MREYYIYYLSLHKNKWNRLLHIVGNLLTILYIILCIRYYPLALLFSPFIIYPSAWLGHWIEGNKPASWNLKNALKAKVCDWWMMIDIVKGKV